MKQIKRFVFSWITSLWWMAPGPTKCHVEGLKRHGEVRRWSSQVLDVTGGAATWFPSPYSKVDAFLFCYKQSFHISSCPPQVTFGSWWSELQIPPSQRFPYVKRIFRFKEFRTYCGGKVTWYLSGAELGLHLVFRYLKKKTLLIIWRMFSSTLSSLSGIQRELQLLSSTPLVLATQ